MHLKANKSNSRPSKHPRCPHRDLFQFITNHCRNAFNKNGNTKKATFHSHPSTSSEPQNKTTPHTNKTQNILYQCNLPPIHHHNTHPITSLINKYKSLSKFRISLMVTTTALVGFGLAPDQPSLNLLHLSATALGTFFSSSAANALNQVIEVQHDEKMKRTAKRILPTRQLSRTHAVSFSLFNAVIGTGMIYYFANPISAALSAGNIFLYAAVYTPLKRVHPINTWVGAVVGAIPPLIGWSAATGNLIHPGAWILFSSLFLWQIAHFLSLSYPLRHDYTHAGYKMLITDKPDVVPRWTWYYNIALAINNVVLFPCFGVLHPSWAILSLPHTMYMLYHTKKFRDHHNSLTARKTFLSGIIYMLSISLMIVMFSKSQSFLFDFNQVDSFVGSYHFILNAYSNVISR